MLGNGEIYIIEKRHHVLNDTLLGVTTLLAYWDIAKVTLPAGQTFYVAIVIADVMREFVVIRWKFTGLKQAIYNYI